VPDDIWNGFLGNIAEMAWHHDTVVGIVRKVTEKHMKERLPSKIDDNTILREERLSEGVQNLRLSLNFVARTFGSNHIVLVDISCPYGRLLTERTHWRKFISTRKKAAAGSPKRHATFGRCMSK
jgi:hypothetical protein